MKRWVMLVIGLVALPVLAASNVTVVWEKTYKGTQGWMNVSECELVIRKLEFSLDHGYKHATYQVIAGDDGLSESFKMGELQYGLNVKNGGYDYLISSVYYLELFYSEDNEPTDYNLGSRSSFLSFESSSAKVVCEDLKLVE